MSESPCANPNFRNRFSFLYCSGGIGGFGDRLITLVPHSKAVRALKVL